MQTVKNPVEVVAVKDETEQQAVPTAWRPVLTQVVSALKDGDYRLMARIPGVESPSHMAAEHIRDNVVAYGATLIHLPEESWESSVCMWQRTHWDVLVDLWTEEEGRSDLVLSTRVSEVPQGYAFQIYMVYVP